MIKLATKFGRYGYRRITALLKAEGWKVNHKRVHRIWRKEGLKVPAKQPKRGRLRLDNGSCVRKRPEYKNHVWSYDFVSERTKNGRAIKMLTVIDEHSRECLAIEVRRKLNSKHVIEVLGNLFLERGTPEFIRSDNGPEFIAKELKKWIIKLGVQPLYIEPGSPWENGYIESFNGKLRDELLVVRTCESYRSVSDIESCYDNLKYVSNISEVVQRACLEYSSTSDKESCLKETNGFVIFKKEVSNVCLDYSSTSDKQDCLKTFNKKQVDERFIGTCLKYSSASDKENCLKKYIIK